MANSKISKKEIIKTVAEDHGMTQEAVTATVDAFLGAIETTLEQGIDVSLHGFGTFRQSHRAARTGRNPKTGEAVPIAASNSVGFKPAAALKARVN